MKKNIFWILTFILFSTVTFAQNVRLIPLRSYKTPTVPVDANPARAALIVMDAITFVTELHCTQKLNKQLEIQLDAAKEKYQAEYPNGISIDLTVFVNINSCNVVGVNLTKDQIIRTQEGMCMIGDYSVKGPGGLIDPLTTIGYNYTLDLK